MAISYRSNKRYLDPKERVSYQGLNLLARGTATVEPETVGLTELDATSLATGMGLVPVETVLSATKVGDQTIPGGGYVTLVDTTPFMPAGATIDSVVAVDQKFTYIYMTGWISQDPEDPTTGHVFFEAHNLQSTPETISNGTVISYRVHTGVPAVQAKSPNAILTVTPGKVWLDDNGDPIDEAISAAGLNETAKPTIAIPAASITETELNSSDIRTAAAKLTGVRGTFVVPTTTSVPPGAKVSLGTMALTAATTKIVRVGQPAGNTGGPIFTGRVTSSNVQTIYAVNNSWNTFSVLAGTLLNVIVY